MLRPGHLQLAPATAKCLTSLLIIVFAICALVNCNGYCTMARFSELSSCQHDAAFIKSCLNVTDAVMERSSSRNHSTLKQLRATRKLVLVFRVLVSSLVPGPNCSLIPALAMHRKPFKPWLLLGSCHVDVTHDLTCQTCFDQCFQRFLSPVNKPFWAGLRKPKQPCRSPS
jgi:hypothetical protein